MLNHLQTQLSLDCDYFIAYSGGLDSHVLLHSMAQWREQQSSLRLTAIHVHHGLSPNADAWMAHCTKICDQLKVPLRCKSVSGAPITGDSVEAWAREARYRIFADILTPGAALLTAHHQDDQTETLLLQLLRGAGPKGLAAMPTRQVFSCGELRRPFLDFTRSQLESYAATHALQWIEDESNASPRFSRNFLRQHIMPVLRERWPTMGANISRSARHCAEAATLLEELARHDLGSEIESPQLPLEILQPLSPARQRNALRHWLSALGCRLPNSKHLERIQQDLLHSRPDASPQISWGHWTIRRMKKHLVVESRGGVQGDPLSVNSL